jgi:hypothetical protein
VARFAMAGSTRHRLFELVTWGMRTGARPNVRRAPFTLCIFCLTVLRAMSLARCSSRVDVRSLWRADTLSRVRGKNEFEVIRHGENAAAAT